mmetsp:Transcript_23331/g.27454  ORF Transcript_23331/g.27454 Transcript_23331/m.27454 type:complete len:81 (-) Transcript_23331:1085-1327(-)
MRVCNEICEKSKAAAKGRQQSSDKFEKDKSSDVIIARNGMSVIIVMGNTGCKGDNLFGSSKDICEEEDEEEVVVAEVVDE